MLEIDTQIDIVQYGTRYNVAILKVVMLSIVVLEIDRHT